MQQPDIQRRARRAVDVGGVVIGGLAPVRVQSMTSTAACDVPATVAQIDRLARGGAELVRVAAATRADTAAMAEIVRRSGVPIVADVHFHFDRALEAIDAGVAKIRLNPGNIRDAAAVRKVIAAAADADVAIRVGVNEGSIVERRDAARRAAERTRPVEELMVEKMADYLTVFQEEGFQKLILSAKSPDAVTCIAVNRLLADRWPYPLHLGVTHAGTARTGAIRSAAALGALLAEGIGDTIRISYAGDPLAEVHDARELLASLRLRRREGIEWIVCPTCGRTEMDTADLADRLAEALGDVRAPLRVAVMGCVVNGPGEADEADLAICGSGRKVVLYRRGERLGSIEAGESVTQLAEQVRALAAEWASRSDRDGG